MKVDQAHLLISAASSKQFPESHCYECVMVGKSNVGKSTLINGIVNRKNLAYVGSRPGKTRLINFYSINEDLMLVDVPGYGYAKRSEKELVQYGALMEDYFSLRPQLKSMIVIMDCRRDMSEDDLMMIDYAKDKKMACCIVLSKSDKISFSQLKNKINSIKSKTQLPVYSFGLKNFSDFEKIREQIDIWSSSK